MTHTGPQEYVTYVPDLRIHNTNTGPGKNVKLQTGPEEFDRILEICNTCICSIYMLIATGFEAMMLRKLHSEGSNQRCGTGSQGRRKYGCPCENFEAFM